jgi:uncharacterized protein
MNSLKITLDTNIWFSAAIGGEISKRISSLLNNQNLVFYNCKETNIEFDDITSRPKNQKFFTPERLAVTKLLIDSFTNFVPILSEIVPISRDPKDDHLLALSKDYDLDYLVTGDKDLLVLKTYSNTRICTFAEFIAELEKLKLI